MRTPIHLSFPSQNKRSVEQTRSFLHNNASRRNTVRRLRFLVVHQTLDHREVHAHSVVQHGIYAFIPASCEYTSNTLLGDAVACGTFVYTCSRDSDGPGRVADGDQEVDLVRLHIIVPSNRYFTEVLLFDAVSDLQQVCPNVERNLLR